MAGYQFQPVDNLSKLGFRLEGFCQWPMEKALAKIAQIGYHSVELCLEHPDLNPDSLTGDAIRRIKKGLEDSGLRLSSVSYHGKRESLSNALKNQKLGIEIAQSLGVGVLVVGAPSTSADPQGCSTFLALEELVRSAEGSGVVIALEPEPDTVIHGLYEFSLLAAHMAGSPLALNLNLGHAALTESDPIEVIEEWAPFIVHTHVEDIRKPNHSHLLPGDGHLDLLRMIKKLRETGYAGDLTIDLFDILDEPDVWAQKAMDRMKLLLQ